MEVLEETIELTTENSVKKAKIGSRIELECRSNLKPPVAYAWSRTKNNQGKEVQIVYRLFLVNCYLLHIPSQLATWEVE